LNAFKTVASFNAQPIEARLFAKKVDDVFQLMRKEAIASGIFYGSSGLTGNLAMLCLLGYGQSLRRWFVGMSEGKADCRSIQVVIW
jgi:hypothetical protein